jgi:hypothetical protein
VVKDILTVNETQQNHENSPGVVQLKWKKDKTSSESIGHDPEIRKRHYPSNKSKAKVPRVRKLLIVKDMEIRPPQAVFDSDHSQGRLMNIDRQFPAKGKVRSKAIVILWLSFLFALQQLTAANLTHSTLPTQRSLVSYVPLFDFCSNEPAPQKRTAAQLNKGWERRMMPQQLSRVLLTVASLLRGDILYHHTQVAATKANIHRERLLPEHRHFCFPWPIALSAVVSCRPISVGVAIAPIHARRPGRPELAPNRTRKRSRYGDLLTTARVPPYSPATRPASIGSLSTATVKGTNGSELQWQASHWVS